MPGARKTPRGAKPNRRGGPARPVRPAVAGSRPSGRLLESRSDPGPRGMIAAARAVCAGRKSGTAAHARTESGLQAHPLLNLRRRSRNPQSKSQNSHASPKTAMVCVARGLVLGSSVDPTRGATWPSFSENPFCLSGAPARLLMTEHCRPCSPCLAKVRGILQPAYRPTVRPGCRASLSGPRLPLLDHSTAGHYSL